jgi:hypothetical protein
MVFQRSGVISGQVEVADQSFMSQELGERFDVLEILRLIGHFSREREDDLRARLTFAASLTFCGWLRHFIRTQQRGLEVVENR